MEHTNEVMAELADLSTGVTVLDLGSYYGATANSCGYTRSPLILCVPRFSNP